MSAPQLKPKKRIRIDRDQPAASIAEDSHSWAVSYADFLMVLLSFFIIFFSIDKNKRTDLVDRISLVGGPGQAALSSEEVAKGKIAQAELPKGLAGLLADDKGLFVDRGTKQRSLSISFEDNIYKSGKIEMPKEQIAKLNELLAKLKPFEDQINITFIGHTDSRRVSQGRSPYLRDNFALSSLRASTALQYAAKAGMDPARMYTKGAAENIRGTRTLSILITPREVDI